VNTPAAIRARAAQVLAQVVAGKSLDALVLDEPERSAQSRGLLRSLVYDSARWYLQLDAILKRLLARPQQRLPPDIHALAIVGLCQLLHTDIPAHAAVAETVNAARVLGKQRASGFLNAVLRRCQREGAQIAADIAADRALGTAHPRWFVEALERDFPDKAVAILDANNARPPFWIRVNRLRIAGPAYREQLAAAGINVIASLYADEALLLERAIDVRELPGFSEGLVSIQDAAAQLAARLLAPARGERVLDACAAPGGKTCHMLELQPELGELVAIDVAASRLTRVRENLARLTLQATLIEGDAEAPAQWWDGKVFNRILLDVPCSATGVIRRHPDIKLLRRSDDIEALARRQASLLENLWPLLAPGGRLVYASCSALRAENANVIEAFLDRHAEAHEVTGKALAAAALTGEAFAAQSEIGLPIAAGTAGMDGFYYACLEKT